MKQKKELTKIWAISAMVCGILGILGCIAPYISIFFSIMGIVFHGINKKRGTVSTMATTGLVLGIIGIVLNVIMLCLVIIALKFTGIF